jgi:hypothetical protein
MSHDPIVRSDIVDRACCVTGSRGVTFSTVHVAWLGLVERHSRPRMSLHQTSPCDMDTQAPRRTQDGEATLTDVTGSGQTPAGWGKNRAMSTLDHITLVVSDYARSSAFYETEASRLSNGYRYTKLWLGDYLTQVGREGASHRPLTLK